MHHHVAHVSQSQYLPILHFATSNLHFQIPTSPNILLSFTFQLRSLTLTTFLTLLTLRQLLLLQNHILIPLIHPTLPRPIPRQKINFLSFGFLLSPPFPPTLRRKRILPLRPSLQLHQIHLIETPHQHTLNLPHLLFRYSPRFASLVANLIKRYWRRYAFRISRTVKSSFCTGYCGR